MVRRALHEFFVAGLSDELALCANDLRTSGQGDIAINACDGFVLPKDGRHMAFAGHYDFGSLDYEEHSAVRG
jgi:hypothetical protein